MSDEDPAVTSEVPDAHKAQTASEGDTAPEIPEPALPDRLFSFSVSYEPRAVRRTYQRLLWRSSGPYYVMMFAITSVLCWQAFANPKSVTGIGMAAFLAGASLVYAAGLRTYFRAADNLLNGPLSQGVRIEFGEDYCSYRTRESMTIFRWRLVTQLHRFREAWVLSGRGSRAIIVIDTRFLPAEARTFLERKAREVRARMD